MRRVVATIAVVAVLLVGSAWGGGSPGSATAVPVRVMPLGDSITYGMGAGRDTVPGGYRAPLARIWAEQGVDVRFVGSLDGNGTAALDRTAGSRSEGHVGWRIDEVQRRIRSWQAAARPDVVLLHLGTNDALQRYRLGTGGADASAAAARLERLIATLFDDDPHVRVVVSTIIPILDDRDGAARELDRRIVDEIVPRFTAEGRSIALVDARAAFTDADGEPRTELYADAAHPDAAGYAVLARVWASAGTPVTTP